MAYQGTKSTIVQYRNITPWAYQRHILRTSQSLPTPKQLSWQPTLSSQMPQRPTGIKVRCNFRQKPNHKNSQQSEAEAAESSQQECQEDTKTVNHEVRNTRMGQLRSGHKKKHEFQCGHLFRDGGSITNAPSIFIKQAS